MALTVYKDKLASQEIREENGRIREIITRRDITDWWPFSGDEQDSNGNPKPVSLGEAVKRLHYEEELPFPGDELLDQGNHPIMNEGRHIYLIDRTFRIRDSNQAQVELRYEYLGSQRDEWVDVDGSLHQLQTHFDNQDPPQPIVLSRAGFAPQGVEVPVLDPRRRAVKTYGRFLNEGETPSSLVGSHLGKVNEEAYLEGEAGTWLVTNMTVTTKVEGSITSSRRPLVQVRVEIEHDPRGYRQYAYWRDPFTGHIAPDLVEDESYKRVDWHGEIDFSIEFDGEPP